MAQRAMRDLGRALIKSFKVTAGKTVTQGLPVKFSTDAETIENTAAGEFGFGVAITSGAEGEDVSVALPFSAIVGVKVGTGGAVAGKMAVTADNGVTNATEGDAANAVGMFMQSGVAGDVVGMGVMAMPLPAGGGGGGVDPDPDPTVMTFTVTAGKSVAEGQPVKFSSGADTIEPATAGEMAIGYANEAGADGDEIEVSLPVVKVVPVTVGTEGATAGSFAVIGSDGFIDAGEATGEAGFVNATGLFLASGAQGDEVPMGILAMKVPEASPADPTIITKTVTAAKTVTAGQYVKFSSGAQTVEPAGAGETGIGIALDSGDAGDDVRIQTAFAKVMTVKVGTEGATAGAYAAVAADGYVDATTIQAEAGLVNVVGVFLATGIKDAEVPMGMVAFTTYAGVAP